MGCFPDTIAFPSDSHALTAIPAAGAGIVRVDEAMRRCRAAVVVSVAPAAAAAAAVLAAVEWPAPGTARPPM